MRRSNCWVVTSMWRWIGSLVFTFWMFFSVAFYALAIIIMGPFGYDRRFAIARAWASMIISSARLLCGIEFEVRGRENIPDEAAVYLLKHSSAYETLAEFLFVGQQTWVLKRELQWVPIFGWALKLLRPIAINRGGGRNAVKQVIAQGTAALQRGVNVMIFPEGTRVRHGQTRRYGMSGIALAAESERLIVPVAHNAGVFWPRRGVRKRPGTVRFVIGEPVVVGDRDYRVVANEVQAWIEAEIAKMPGRESLERAGS